MPFVAGNKKLPAFFANRERRRGKERNVLQICTKKRFGEGGRKGVGLAIQAEFWVRSNAQNRSHSLAESPTVMSALNITEL